MGDTALDAGADLDVKSWRGQAVLLALTIGAQQAHGLAPNVPLASDIVGTFYAESNGAQASAAVDLHPRAGGGFSRGAAVALLVFAGLIAAVSAFFILQNRHREALRLPLALSAAVSLCVILLLGYFFRLPARVFTSTCTPTTGRAQPPTASTTCFLCRRKKG